MEDTTVTGGKGHGRNDPQYRNVGPMTLTAANKYETEGKKIEPIPTGIEIIRPPKKVPSKIPIKIYEEAKKKIKKPKRYRIGREPASYIKEMYPSGYPEKRGKIQIKKRRTF